MRWGAVVAAVLAVLLLGGCAGHKTHPRRGHIGHASNTSGATAGVSTPDANRDDTSLPQDRRYRHDRDGGPDGAHVDIASLPEPVPRVEPRSRYGNKATYSVRGKTYHVLGNAKGYDERGIASWYGNKFHGYMTSSFEKYDMYKFTAAHKTLPLPSWARVTNLANGKSVIVRVNDRGPFVANRLIDLSYAAAVRIGIWPRGTGLVEVRAIDPAHPQELPPPPAVPAGGAHPGIWLQVGAFADAANAARVAGQLERAGVAPVQVTDALSGGRHVHRVRLGPLRDADQADRVSAAVVRMGLPQPQIAVD
jgi:rare lipoprotein A